MPKPRPLRFDRTEKGCLVCVSHKPNKLGYIYVPGSLFGRPDARGRLHRFAYEQVHGIGSIPEGFHLDHICGVRACAEPKHLRPLSPTDHAEMTSATRWDAINEERRVQWLAHGRNQTGMDISKLYGVDPKTGRALVKCWAREYEEDLARPRELEGL